MHRHRTHLYCLDLAVCDLIVVDSFFQERFQVAVWVDSLVNILEQVVWHHNRLGELKLVQLVQ